MPRYDAYDLDDKPKFEFVGKVIQAYYTNSEDVTKKTAVIIYSADDNKAREYHVPVDEDDPRFRALLYEVPYEKLDEVTNAQNESHKKEFEAAFARYAEKNNLRTEAASMATTITDLLNFDPEDESQSETLFEVKLAVFEFDAVKNSSAEDKTKVRTATTPLQVLVEYHNIINK